MAERAGRKTLPGNTRVLETKGRMRHGEPNPGNRLTPPGVEATRAAILAGTCPFCGKTGFKLLAGHTYRAHGVDRMELRSMGGFVLKESICAPEVSDAARIRTTRRVASGELWRGNRLGGPRNISDEGKRRQAGKNKRMGERVRARYEANPDRCAVCEAPIPFEKHNDSITCGDACRRARLAQKATAQARRAGKLGKERPPKPCAVCGTSFHPRGDSRTRTCGTECKAALIREQGMQRRKAPGECKICGGPVERQPSRTPAKTCSPQCLRKLFAERDAKRRKERSACAICGKQIPGSMPATAKTCGPVCLTTSKSRAMAAWRQRPREARSGPA